MNFLAQEWMLVSLLAVLVAVLLYTESRKGGQALSFNQVTQLLNKEEAVLLDVREAKEYKAGHIVNAINIPHLKLKDRIGELDKFKDKTIVIADKLGQHAGSCGKQLRDNGYTTVRLQGGMSEWFGQNLPVAKG